MWGVSPPHPKPPETYMCDDRLYYTKVKTYDVFGEYKRRRRKASQSAGT